MSLHLGYSDSFFKVGQGQDQDPSNETIAEREREIDDTQHIQINLGPYAQQDMPLTS